MAWNSTLAPSLLWMLGLMFCSLAAGSLARLVAVRRTDADTRRRRLASLKTWWTLAIVLAAAILLQRTGVCLLMIVASGLAMRDYARLVATRPADRTAMRLVYVAIPVHYGSIFWTEGTDLLVCAPLALLLMLVAVQVLQGDTQGYVRSTAGMFWGAMVLVYGLSFAALLVMLPYQTNPVAGPTGWFLYLVVLTETNDIAQALVGRRFGAHKQHRITPRVSPNKTWEGFLGGTLITILLAIALSPVLTPLHKLPVIAGDTEWPVPFFWPAVAGVLIAISGFIGDINMSAVKRDAGVKDSSGLLPGMGGMIDRIDSLTVAAPVFYFFVLWLTR